MASKKQDPRALYIIEGTKAKIAVPYSIEQRAYTDCFVNLFGRRLKIIKLPLATRPGILLPIDPLPSSWFEELGVCE